MARGHQKELAQQKNAKKQAALKKGGQNQKEAAKNAFKIQCVICKVICFILSI